MNILSRDKWKQRINLLLVFLLIYISEDTLLFGTNRDRRFFYIKIVFVVGLACVLFLADLFQKKRYYKSVLVLALVLAFNLVCTCLFWGETDNRNAYMLALLLLSVAVVNRMEKAEFIRHYTGIMKFLALFSVGQYALFLLAYPVTLLAPQMFNINGYRFSNWIFTVSLNKEHYYIMPYRNWGIYREPGVYMGFLVLALMLEAFCKPKPKMLDIGILVAAIVTTFSTAGYFILVPLLLTYLLQSGIDGKKKFMGILGIAAVLAAALICINAFEIPVYNWLFKKINVDGGSGDSRFGSVLSNLALFAKSPLLGNGWLGMAENSATIQNVITTHHNTNTLLMYFAIYGVVFGSVMLWGSIRFFTGLRRGVAGWLMALCWILALSNENLTLNNIVCLVAFYGLVYGKAPAPNRTAQRKITAGE